MKAPAMIRMIRSLFMIDLEGLGIGD